MKKNHIFFLLFVLAVLPFSTAGSVHAASSAAWVAEWDAQKGIEEIPAIQARSIVLFAAYFDSENKPFLSEAMQRMLKNTPRKNLAPDGDLYLSVVNDVFYSPNKSLQKDPSLITSLMATEKSRALHKADLLRLLASGPFDGLEIDYERVDPQAWAPLLDFAADLANQLAAQGKKLRFLLEPKKQYLQIPLTKGPEYVLMGYNLFGGHSGPGPKANAAFLRKLATESSAAAYRTGQKIGLALATGGFAWPTATGLQNRAAVVAVNEMSAAAWARGSQAALVRDPESRALHFVATDTAPGSPIPARNAKNSTYEIWYADGETLSYWIQIGQSAGFGNISLWRLGGNVRESLSRFAEATK